MQATQFPLVQKTYVHLQKMSHNWKVRLHPIYRPIVWHHNGNELHCAEQTSANSCQG